MKSGSEGVLETTNAPRSAERADLSRRPAVYPASLGQQRLWFLDQLDHAAGAAYHLASGWRLRGSLDEVALRLALDVIVARHAILRTRFALLDEQPMQYIEPADAGFHCVQHDLSCLSAEAQRERIDELSTREASEPFDLSTGPLIRGRLLRLAAEDHLLLFTQHHIISDGWSEGVLRRELKALYAAFSQGQGDPLPPLDLQYADYALWQRQWLRGPQFPRQRQFWKSHLDGAPALLQLPTDRQRAAEQNYAGSTLPLTLSPGLTAALRRLSRRNGVTMFMTLLASWSVLLSRLSGQTDVVIGTPVANRSRREFESLLGFFANTLALRVRLEEDPTVADLLRQIRTTTLQAYAHQEIPFERVVETLQPERSLSHNPIFQAMLAYHSSSGEEGPGLPGLKVREFRPPRRCSIFDLTLWLRDAGETIEGALEYATDLFENATIERMATQLQAVLDAMVEDDQQRISRLNLLPPPQWRQLLVSFNDTRTPYQSELCIHELFEARAASVADAPAVLCEDGQLSFGELNRRANQLAHHLIAMGVRPDDRVAICMQRGLDLMVGLLGILKAGGAYVPLDPAYPRQRLAYMLADSAPVAVLTQSAARAALPPLALPVVMLDLQDTGSIIAQAPQHNPAANVLGLTSSHLAYVIYTSGSTGLPKGVMIEHRSVVNLLSAMACRLALRDCDVLLAVTTLSFDIAALELYLPLVSGAQLLLASASVAADAQALSRLIRRHNVTVMQATPAAWRLLLTHGWQGCAELRVLCGGEALPTALAEALAANIRELWNLYGPTETTIWSTMTRVCGRDGAAIASIGRPIANTQIYILDARGGPVPIGVVGEIHIGGAGVARGYLNRPELTAERFVPDPFSNAPDARMYKSGDLGRWRSDGNIEFLGRNDFQVKVRGFRIELGEIEARLAACPWVREAVVLVREDSAAGKQLVAYVTGQASAEQPAAQLRSQLSTVLPEYMVPSAFVTLETFPLTPNGKLDRKALPAPDQSAVVSAAYQAPVGQMEQAIAQIWQTLLGLPRIGRDDNFFELGGHSLIAVTMISRLRQGLGVEVSLASLFTRPVLAEFAQVVREAARCVLPPITAARRDEPLPLSFAQQRLWFLAQMQGIDNAYHVPLGLRLSGELDNGALRRALDRLVARHEALRTSFRNADGQPVQRTAAEDIGFDLQENDLRQLSDAAGELQRLAIEEVDTAFDLQVGPLIRGRLVRLDDREHVLFITMHHIVSDGWSIGVLTHELGVLYGAYCQGQTDPLPRLAVQYPDYALWQRRWLAGEVLQTQSDYWRRTLADAPAVLELPADRQRPAQQNYAGAFVALKLDQELTGRLKALSQRHGATLFMTLLAGWAALLARLSGQDDVVIGVPAANRGRAEIEPLIGCFVNSLALRLDFSGSPTTGEALQRVKARATEAQQHQDLPFEQVVDILRPTRSLAHTPVFQVMFAWQNAGASELALPGLSVAAVKMPYSVANFDLTLNLAEADGCIVGGLQYATALFDRATLERHAGYLRTLLEAMSADDARPLDRLALLSEAERHQLVVEWNDTAADYPQDRCVHDLFDVQAARTPHALAIVHEDAQLTYAQLHTKADHLAHHLKALGIKPAALVAIGLERSIELVLAELAILKCGAGYVPLDHNAPMQRQAFILKDCQAQIVLSAKGRLVPEISGVQRVDIDQLTLTGPPSHEPAAPVDSEATAYVMYTSGSTGQPKGVVIPHRAVGRLVLNNGYADFQASDRVALAANPAFDASTMEVWGALLNGGRIVVIDQAVLLDPEVFNRGLRHHAINVLFLTTGLFHQYADALAPVFSRLRYLIAGGDVLDARISARVLHGSPPQHLLNGYGPTETTTFAATHEVRKISAGKKMIPIGRPISNTRIYILDRYGEPVPIGVTGEIYIGGAGVARGYLNRPQLTAQRFVADPFVEALDARLYRSGDLGRYLPDGNIEFLGRDDSQVKIRGFRIELGEIEAQLAQHPAVRDALVLVRDDGADKRLVAYYTVAADAPAVEAEALRRHLSATLPEYMLPAAYVRLHALPLTANGKLNRAALPAPAGAAYVVRGFEAPAGEIESHLARIWAELLKLERVGRHDNFFELGGHSLAALQLVSRVASTFGVQIGVAALFASPTLREFAIRVSRADMPLEAWNIVQIQPLGQKTPIIAINNTMMYSDLARRIGTDRRFLAVQLFDPANPRSLPARSLEDITTDYVQLIREAQPHGPYILMGLCVAGLVAYEAARQLRQAGEQVALVVMADTWCPGYVARPSFLQRILFDLERRLIYRRHTLALLRSGSIRIEQFLATTRVAKWTKLMRVLSTLRLIEDHSKLTEQGWQDRWFLPALESARSNYQAPVSTGHVVMLQSEMLPLAKFLDPKMGWSNLVKGQLLHYRVPGWHDRMFHDRGAAMIAEHLQPLLDRIDT